MLNKKLLAITSIVTILLTSNSYAETQGAYLGVDVSKLNVIDEVVPPRDSDISNTFGVNAKYAVNFNNFFFAPGVFADYNNARKKEEGYRYTVSRSVKNRYGIKADLGYDINDNFAAYVTGGVAKVQTNLDTTGFSGSEAIYYKKSYYRAGAIYGAGLLYHCSDKLTFNLQYDTQLIKAKFEPFEFKFQNKYVINAFRIGASYHF